MESSAVPRVIDRPEQLMTKKKAERSKDPPKYEAIRARLEEVVTRLERGEGTLEESLALYEEGVRLVRASHEILDAAEKRLEILKPQPDGSFRIEDRTKGFGEAGAAAGAADEGEDAE